MLTKVSCYESWGTADRKTLFSNGWGNIYIMKSNELFCSLIIQSLLTPNRELAGMVFLNNLF
jgi:hypothetical protein